MSRSRTKSTSARSRGQKVIRLLAAPSRTRLLSFLRKGEASVGDIAEHLVMSHSAVSHQLGVLAEADVVAHRRDGRIVRYAIARTAQGRLAIKLLKAIGA